MMEPQHTGTAELDFIGKVANATDRRSFLRWSGLTVGVMALGACSSTSANSTTTVDLGAGDIGVLNYAYALEQLEAAFYTQVLASPYSGMTTEETTILTDLKGHEVIHRDFFKAALGAQAIPSLSVTFTSINFASRASVLGAAAVFEDLGVSAYNYAGQLITSPDYLLIAGKIVSVEARHASAIRDLLQPNTAYFAGDDVVTPATALDGANMVSLVLDKSHAGAYITTSITYGNLPTS